MNDGILPQPKPHIPPGRLWFGSVGTVAVWFLVELADVAIAWEACQRGAEGTGQHAAVRTLLGVLTALSLGLAVAAWLTSYKTWRLTGEQPDFAGTEAHGRWEFMSFVGVLVSSTLGVGIVLFMLPILVLGGCWGMY